MVRNSLLLSVALLAAPAWSADVAKCSPKTPVDTFCQIKIAQVRPTQSAVGELQVGGDIATIRKQKNLEKWQKKKLIPVVLGPDGEFYLTDRHHTSRGLWEAGEKKMLVKVIGKLDQPATFWSEMQARHWVYLLDERGQPVKPQQLPRSIAELRDDPYRALAGFAQDKGYYDKTPAYFMEFEWARYFGKAMNWQPINAANLDASLAAARKLACAPEARSLPGYAAASCSAVH